MFILFQLTAFIRRARVVVVRILFWLSWFFVVRQALEESVLFSSMEEGDIWWRMNRSWLSLLSSLAASHCNTSPLFLFSFFFFVKSG